MEPVTFLYSVEYRTDDLGSRGSFLGRTWLECTYGVLRGTHAYTPYSTCLELMTNNQVVLVEFGW